MRVKDALGRFGEQLALAHLRDGGLSVLATNWRCPRGELDIVAREDNTLVFVEVKTRSSTAFGDPAEAVDAVKAARIRSLALAWLAERRVQTPEEWWSDLRFDVVAVIRFGAAGRPTVRHLRAAF